MFNHKQKQIILISAILFFGSICYMFSQLDSSSKSAMMSKSAADIYASETNNLLHAKVSALEMDLKLHKESVMELKEELKRVRALALNPDGRKSSDKGKSVMDKINALKKPKHGSPSSNQLTLNERGTCPAVRYIRPDSDIVMYDKYEEYDFSDVDGGVWKQGWNILTSDDEWRGRKLKVFVVPHSHNDPGWIKTVEKYFLDQTQHILNNIVDHLYADGNRKFIWAEMSYLSMWWSIASEERKVKAQQVIGNGQLEIVTGGWVMNDEANTHYFAMIDQLIEGQEWLSRTFSVVPRTGWAIDPFGHTSTMAYILKQMKFDNMLIQRVHYHVKKQLAFEQNLEFRWRPLWADDGENDMVCHMMPFYSYDVPHTCGPDPKICCQFDFARLPGNKNSLNCPWKVAPRAIDDRNIEERSKTLLDQYRKKSKLFKTDAVLAILGDDFRYVQSKEMTDQYDNYKKIIDYVDQHPELNAQIRIATLSEYFDEVRNEIGGAENLPSLSGDFYTYADREDHYWSGYYVTRPYHKMQERILESHLRGAEIMFTLAHAAAQGTSFCNSFTSKLYPLLRTARQNLGLFQHHDGITGTARQHVVVDYGNKLMEAVVGAKQIISDSARVLLKGDYDQASEMFSVDEIYRQQGDIPTKLLVDIPAKESGDAKVVVVYNSLSYERTSVVHFMVSVPDVIVRNSDGDVIESQINLVWGNGHHIEKDRYELVFVATVPPMGLATYLVSEGYTPNNDYSTVLVSNAEGSLNTENQQFNIEHATGDEIVLENQFIKAHFNTKTGLLHHVTTKSDNVKSKVTVDFHYYTSRNKKDKSGAYLFLPDGPARPHAPNYYRNNVVRFIKGTILSETHVVLPNLVHKITIYHGDACAVQPLGLHIFNNVDIRDQFDNKELAMRVESDVQSQDRFFTDLNGYQITARKYYDKLPLQGNFYPIPSMAFIQDSNKRLSILTAQPLGFASLRSGQMDVVLDRRLMQDDNRGLGQPITDNVPTPHTFVLLLEKWLPQAATDNTNEQFNAYPSLAAHHLSLELLHPTRSMFTEQIGGKTPLSSLTYSRVPDGQSLPCDLHVLNLRTIEDREGDKPTDSSAMLLHRLGYECGLDSSSKYTPTCSVSDSESISVSSTLQIGSVRGTSLNLQFDEGPTGPDINIKPMEIQAYKVQLS